MEFNVKELFVCFTVYQLKISKLLIRKNNVDNYILLYFGVRTNKIDNYLKDLELNNVYFFFYSGNKFIKYIKLNLFLNKFNNKFNNVYIATLNAIEIKFLLKKIDYKKLIGFDDGIGSILLDRKDGLYMENTKFLSKLFFFIYGINSYKYLHNHIFKFYGVYPKEFYPFKNFEHISLFNDVGLISYNGKSINIFIGQPFDKIGVNNEKIYKILISLNIDFFIPHPSFYLEISDIKTLSSNFLAEDIILGFIKEGYVVNLYSFFSSVLYNLVNVKNVNCSCVYIKELHQFISAYELGKKVGVNVIEFTDL